MPCSSQITCASHEGMGSVNLRRTRRERAHPIRRGLSGIIIRRVSNARHEHAPPRTWHRSGCRIGRLGCERSHCKSRVQGYHVSASVARNESPQGSKSGIQNPTGQKKRQTRIPESELPELARAIARRARRGNISVSDRTHRIVFECQGDVKVWCLKKCGPGRRAIPVRLVGRKRKVRGSLSFPFFVCASVTKSSAPNLAPRSSSFASC